MMIRNAFILLIVFNVANVTSQRVSIGVPATDSSAILDLYSIDKGFLLPRMTTVQRNAILKPKIGLTILNTDDGCEDIYNGQNWTKNCNFTKISADTMHSVYWTQKSDFDGLARAGATSFIINDKVYLVTGETYPSIVSKEVWEYDFVSDTWTKKNDFPGLERHSAVAFGIGGKGYLCTGLNIYHTGLSYQYVALKDVWEYDPILDIWTQKSDFPGTARYGAASFVLNDKGYLTTGNFALSDVWEYDPPLDTWTQKSVFPGGGRRYATSITINGKAYLGLGSSSSFESFDDLWEYDVLLDTWIQKSDCPGGERHSAVGFSINNKGYFGTGYAGGNLIGSNTFWEYNPLLNEWIQIKSLDGASRKFAIGFSINNYGFVGTGSLGSYTIFKDFWQLTFDGKEFQEMSPIDALQYKGHDWTNNINKLYNSNLNTKIGIGTNLPETKLHINSPFELINNSNSLLQLGASDGANIVMNKNKIKSSTNGIASNLYLQNDGGNTFFGDTMIINGDLDVNGNIVFSSGEINSDLNVGGHIMSDVLSVNNLKINGEIIGSIKYDKQLLHNTVNFGYYGINPSKTFEKILCISGDCTTCSGSNCPYLILNNWDVEGHPINKNGQLLILQGSGEPNRNIYMPCCAEAYTNYKLSDNFQLTAENTISLVWMEPENLWYELSRSINE